MNKNKRLSILSPSEQKNIYELPDFTKEERNIYFSLNTTEQNIVQTQLRGINSQILFILQLGYFRALFKFFSFTALDVQKDILSIIEKHFPTKALSDVSLMCNKKTKIQHRKLIKTLYSYQDVTSATKQKLLKKSESILLKDSNPKYIFKELNEYLNKKRYILPAYSTMQKLISRALENHERRVIKVINNRITTDIAHKLDDLLSKESEHRYHLALIKAPPNSFTLMQATKEREKKDFLDNLYPIAKTILKEIGIGQQSIKYYARLVDQFTVQRLLQFEKPKQYFYIFCFIYHRYVKINDALILTFLYQVTKFNNKVSKSMKEKIAILNLENLQNLKKGSDVLDLITSDEFCDEDNIGALRKKAYNILDKDKINKLSAFLKNSNIDINELRWKEFDKQGHQMRPNTRHIFKSIAFKPSSDPKNTPLYTAVRYLQDLFINNKRKMESPPLSHVPKSALKYLFKNSKTKKGKILDIHRYEALIYKLLKKKIASSDIFIPDSIEYRSIENDLIDRDFYLNNKHSIHMEYDNDFLSEDIATRLDRKLAELDKLIDKANQRIISEQNKHFKYTDDKNTKWHIEYQGIENKDINNPIFQKLHKIGLPQLLWLINKHTDFFNVFTHILYKDAKVKPEHSHIIGNIIAYGTNMGLSKMASCSNIKYSILKSTRDAFLRDDTLKSVNDRIVNAIEKLPIHELYKIGGTIHSAVDGKKYDAAGNIFNARHSPKYFNLGTGISILTLMINFLPTAIKLISPNEYEGNFGLELLLMNETNLQSEINSTDMHGINDLNFALYDAAGYDFQPRYTNLYEVSQTIVSSAEFMKEANNYIDYIIKPQSCIDRNLIISEEDNFKRIIGSILSKTCSVSTIVKKLSLTLKSHKTRKAIAEYNKILRSIHILKSINNNNYRQNIQKALNRTELYHFLTGEVGYANRGKIIAKTEAEQLVFKESTRLLCNAILYYNSVILSQIYTNCLKNGKHRQIELLKHISPIAWVNINLYGVFELKNKFNARFPEPKIEDLDEQFLKNDNNPLL